MSSREPIDQAFVERAFEQIARRVEDADGALDSLTQEERALFALLYIDGVIANGGFAALFYNPSGEYWMDAIDAAERVGAMGHAGLLREGAATFPQGQVPRDDDARNERLESVPEDTLETLDERWYALADGLEEEVVRYVEQHYNHLGLGGG